MEIAKGQLIRLFSEWSVIWNILVCLSSLNSYEKNQFEPDSTILRA